MRLAVALWDGIDAQHPDRTVERLNTIGVKGLGHISGKDSWTDAELQRIQETFDANGIFIGEVTLYQHGWRLASREDRVRTEGIASINKALSDACTLKAHCVGLSTIAEPGERDLWSAETWKRLVEGTGVVAATAERLGMDVGFHPCNRGPLDTPAQLRRIVDDVGSPRVKVILDPVNMSTHRTCYHTTVFLNQMFDLLGDVIIAAHAKDVYVDTSHWVLRIDEVPLGKGALDYETYLKRLAALGEEVVLTIEHLRDVGVSGSALAPNYVEYNTDVENTRARAYIQRVAQRIGVAID